MKNGNFNIFFIYIAFHNMENINTNIAFHDTENTNIVENNKHDKRHIKSVMIYANVSEDVAIEALDKNNGDVVNAIMFICS